MSAVYQLQDQHNPSLVEPFPNGAVSLSVFLEITGGLGSAQRVLELFTPFEELLLHCDFGAQVVADTMVMQLTLLPSDRTSIILSKIAAAPYTMSLDTRRNGLAQAS